jgi:hypothetical protein
MLHAEHRLLVPRLIWLPLAVSSGWDIRWELLSNGLLLGAIYAAVAIETLRARMAKSLLYVSLVFTALVAFNLCQVENLIWGWQLSLLIAAASTVGVIVLLTTFSSVRSFVLASLFALAATFSFGGGILAWPLGVLALITRRPLSRRHLVAWLSLAGISLTLYANVLVQLLTFHWKTSQRPHLGGLLPYGLAYLGSPIAGWSASPRVAALTGLFGIFVLMVVTTSSVRRRGWLPTLGASWTLTILFALGNAALTTLSRTAQGLDQALASRYTTFGGLFWLGLVLGLLRLPQVSGQGSSLGQARDGPSFASPTPWALSLVAVLALFLGVSSLHGLRQYRAQYEVRAPIRERLVAGELEFEDFQYLFPDAAEVLSKATTLCRLEMGPFRGERPPACNICIRARTEPRLVLSPVDSAGGSVTGWVRLATFEEGRMAIFQGWAMESGTNFPIQEVAVSDLPAEKFWLVRRRRPRVARDQGNRCSAFGGFELGALGDVEYAEMRRVKLFARTASGKWSALRLLHDEANR